MKIIITESQAALIRRLNELEHYLDIAIKKTNDEIKGGIFGPGNKPDNFGVYENWLINRIKNDFEVNNPKIEFLIHDFKMLVSGQFNDKIKKGFNEVKKRK
jgi:hypothetical protein